MQRQTNTAATRMALSMRRKSAAPAPDMRGLAGVRACAALACGLASYGDVRAGNYLAAVLGWLLVSVLLQRAVYALAHPQGPAPADWITPIAAAAWMFAFILANEAVGFYWCIPVLLAIALNSPSPGAGPLSGALGSLAALATYPSSGIELAGTAAVLLACTAAIGSLANGGPLRPPPADTEEASTRWGSAATVCWEAEGNTIAFSDSFKTMLGYDASMGHTPFNFFDLVHPDDRMGLERTFRAELRLVRTGAPPANRAIQVRLLARDGTWRWVVADIVALFVSKSAVSQGICSFFDVTAHVVAQDALAATRRSLQAQTADLLNVRERLRDSELARRELHKLVPQAWEGPATAADAVLAGLQATSATGSPLARSIALARSHLDEASRQTQWVIHLALMEQSQWHPPRVPLDIMVVMADVAATVRPLAQSRGVVLEMTERSVGALALGHEQYCRLALEAIVRDAVLAARAGSMVSLSGTARSGRVGVELRQSGVMPATRRATYFDRPPQGGGIAPASPYAARMIVRALGGDIVLVGSSRHGTSLLLMLEQAPDKGDAPVTRAALDILVAGGAACRQLVTAACAGLRADVRQAPDGLAAIDAVILRRPDVIVADATVGLDGFLESFSAIRAMQRGALEPPSLWISMGALDSVHAGGFDHCVPDPAARQALSDLLLAILTDKQAVASAIQVDPSLLKAVPQYVESRKRMAAELREALAAGRRVEAARMAHQLGGSPGLRGFDAAVLACRAIGDLDSNEPLDRLLSRMDEVDDVLRRLDS